MRIGDLADATGVSRRLLRYYEEQGLLDPVRQANGYREYAPSDVGRVRRIRAMLAAGLPTAVIGRLLRCVHEDDDPTPLACPAFIADLHREHARIEETITHLQSTQKSLESLLKTALLQQAAVTGAAAGETRRESANSGTGARRV
ncbi:MerR family transcriptional regulator [Bailinhaonella thermotolerans]|uniref:MerR family transcriptional regulator n=1 Tax=Bailinhaonella thermotolerans TaxID=1070861 RepID=A0A3A4BQ15_9ACTN|nr:MerR family transcriptional regulator [Bailinhaonella thermotolerans]RJL33236.1 MerR family transcriptional regulator [Bailinhaonella thermotolerans]